MELPIMSKKILSPVTAALGAAVVISLSGMQIANANENPFSMSDLGGGYMVSENHEGSCGGMKEGQKAADHEGKCGEAMKKECAAAEHTPEMKEKCDSMMKEGEGMMKDGKGMMDDHNKGH